MKDTEQSKMSKPQTQAQFRNVIIDMARDTWKVPKHIPDEQVWAYVDKINLKKVGEPAVASHRSVAIKVLNGIKERIINENK